MLAGDTKDLKLGSILRLNHNLKNGLKKATRINPKYPNNISILDNIITDIHAWYQKLKRLAPFK